MDIHDAPSEGFSQETLMDKFPEWRAAVGEFVAEFAECEWWTCNLAREVFSPTVAQMVVELRFEARARFVTAQMADSDPPHAAAMDALFARMKKLADSRNLIAHNPPRLNIYSNPPKFDKSTMQIELQSARNPNKSATLEEIKNWTKDAHELSQELIVRAFQLGTKRFARGEV